MHGKLSDVEPRASFSAARCGHESEPTSFLGTIVPSEQFPIMVRQLWPVKGDAALSEFAGVAERTARAYRRGDREAAMSVLWLLLRSREGYRVLRFIMESGEPPDWWLNTERHRHLGAAVEQLVKGGQNERSE